MSDEGEKSSWLEPLPEEYANDGDISGRRMLIAALTVVVLAIFGGLIWYSYLEGSGDTPVPVVRADNSVVKQKPDNPGGMEVPNQDKEVFVKVGRADEGEQAKLAPTAELPVERPSASKIIETAKKEADKAVMPPKSSDVDVEKEVVKKEVKKAGKTTPQKVAAIAPSSNGNSGKFLVQLGAFGDRNKAEQLWIKIQAKNDDVLAGLTSDITVVDLGKKGVLYRLRSGMVVDRPSADKICRTLKSRKQPCIVVGK